MATNQNLATPAAQATEKPSAVEILNLLSLALSKDVPSSDHQVLIHAHVALDQAWHRGYKRGREEGYQAVLIAAGQAETVAALVIEGMCRREGGR